MAVTLTPMLQQYQEIKSHHPDAILFFRLGDFFEMFFQDAILASRELEIVLTSREGGGGERVPMCGIPWHAADGYIARLMQKGYRVAICEQVEDPKQAKGLVRREVVRVITPGTFVENGQSVHRENSFLTAWLVTSQGCGLAVADLSTGEFRATEAKDKQALDRTLDEILRLQPRECLLEEGLELPAKIADRLQQESGSLLTRRSSTEFSLTKARTLLQTQFKVVSLDALGLLELNLTTRAAGAVLSYLLETLQCRPEHMRKLIFYTLNSRLIIDTASRRNLELTIPARSQYREHTLLGVIDETVTAMGSRRLRQWLEEPLLDIHSINQRLNANEELRNSYAWRLELHQFLTQVNDLERILGRLALNSSGPREVAALGRSLKALAPIATSLRARSRSELLRDIATRLDDLPGLWNLIDRALVDDPPASPIEGGLIREGFNPDVDKLHQAAGDARLWIAELERVEREKTGIKYLRVGYNKIFGYFLEVTRPNLSLVPVRYVRRQTLANSERYVIPELREKEVLILDAEEKLHELEYQLFCELRMRLLEQLEPLQRTTDATGELDAILALAEVAGRPGYTRPELVLEPVLQIIQGRHPVVQQVVGQANFVPNDLQLGAGRNLVILTGPNMAGKSTFIRSIALLVIMAQIGSFVPADKARIGITDRIFARIGAADDLAGGQSTFMVEMNEVANILNNAGPKSLIILDEVGRGTSTYDGVSIARALCEYLQDKIGARSLFATHYHELAELSDYLPGVVNLYMAVKEDGETIVFLRQVLPGAADRSYGIHVARLANLPTSLLERAAEVLLVLENSKQEHPSLIMPAKTKPGPYPVTIPSPKPNDPRQLSLFPSEPHQAVITELSSLDLMGMTPLEAINKLFQLQQALREETDLPARILKPHKLR